MAEPNKRDGVFTGGTQTITRPSIAAIPPNKPRPEMVKKTRFSRGQPTNSP